MLEKLIDKAKNAMKEALVDAEKITDGRTMSEKTNILNANYHMAQFYAYLELIEDIDLDTFVKLGEETMKDGDRVLERIDRLY
ncbi:MAG: hypothetical protein KHZ13_13200 [Firmicutes bacterium]|nr:hypothetical protein [Bacillota bacterium]